MKKLNPTQNEILVALKYLGEARFRDLNKDKLPTDLFSYHLNHLQKSGLIEKVNTRYILSQKGAILVGRLDDGQIKLQSKLHFSFVCTRRNKNGEEEILVHRRSKVPYSGWTGFPSAKIDLDEKYIDNANAKLAQKTGLQGELEFKGLHHVLAKVDGKIIEDKSFFIVKVSGFSGKLLKKTNEGENLWIKPGDLLSKKQIFPEIEKYLEIIESERFHFFESEQEYKTI